MKDYIVIVLCILINFTIILGVYAQEESFEFHLAFSQSSRIHRGPNSAQICPGLSIVTAFCWPDFTLESAIHGGLLIGYDITISLHGLYSFRVDAWRPGLGLSASLSFGSALYHTENIDNFIYPSLPNYLIGILISPLEFDCGEYRLSTLKITIESDVRYLFRVFVFDISLLQVTFEI